MQSWIILSILTSVGAVLLLAPVLRWRGGRAAPDLEASLDRLMAIEQRAAAGDLSAEHAAVARAEIRRRIMWAHRAEASVHVTGGERKCSAARLAGGAIIGAVAFYLAYESLDLSDARPSPAAVHQDDREGAAAVEALATATAQSRSPPLAIRQDGQPQRALGSVDEMVERLVARLKANPKDTEGWSMLGWSYVNTDRFEAAAGAYAKAIDLAPHKADLHSAYGEALVRAAGGTVTDKARAAFQEALRRDGKDARARFFIGMRKVQDGDRQAALDDWTVLLGEADTQEPWFADLKQRVTELGREFDVNVLTHRRRDAAAASGGVLALLDQPRPAAGTERTSAATNGPGIPDATAPAPADRSAMIRGMVEGLAARLEQTPNDVEGWVRLIRSRKVLGEAHEAQQAFRRAMDVFKEAPAEQAKIVAIGEEIGLAK